ncbi:phosphodiester glycosidase family protein [Deinococcus multiflagellatus]|uniref:phosphodiester glycosidase family protein n=1 Tax=Deinococcus multiflagellatus TaxID=1656887 RepID=UPI001CC9671F|nr:phosphodiester glycosidase family protein [Deinococcus multiflagellatus]MBZ9714357.1 phosphodiester glycosidase family protein [Deinococcus multiflagellatus]
MALALLGALLGGAAGARPVAIGGLVQGGAVDTRQFAGGEALALWTLPRLGVAVRNDPQDVRLLYGTRELRYAPATGWRAVGFPLPQKLPLPELAGGSLYVPLAALTALGVPVLADTPGLLNFAAPASVPADTLPPSPVTPAPAPVPTPSPVPPPPAALDTQLSTVRVSRTLHRTVEVQRVVLELTGPVPHTVTREAHGLSITLPGVGAQPGTQTLASGDTLSITAGPTGSAVYLGTNGGRSEVFTLADPPRIVVDTTTYTDDRVPPPVNPDTLPEGVTYRVIDKLHLLSFDPALYAPRVVTAPAGRASGVADLVRSVGGIAGVNGGYFDPASNLPVDLVAVGGLMTAPSLEKRATLGFTAQGETLFGYPRPRYVLSGPGFSVTVNTVRSKPDAALLTAFVGDGSTRVGADTLTTLHVIPGATTVARAVTGVHVPPAGTLAFTFDPARFPQLPQAAGAPLTVSLNWRAADAPWDSAQDALSAGPLLVQGGRVALNPAREGFNTAANIWRPTRQVALGTLGGQPTVAYFEHGTPEAFAAALAAAGVRDAVRLDSGSSSSAYLVGGYAGLGGYLNTVWSRPVPNAVVFVPRSASARK